MGVGDSHLSERNTSVCEPKTTEENDHFHHHSETTLSLKDATNVGTKALAYLFCSGFEPILSRKSSYQSPDGTNSPKLTSLLLKGNLHTPCEEPIGIHVTTGIMSEWTKSAQVRNHGDDSLHYSTVPMCFTYIIHIHRSSIRITASQPHSLKGLRLVVTGCNCTLNPTPTFLEGLYVSIVPYLEF